MRTKLFLLALLPAALAAQPLKTPTIVRVTLEAPARLDHGESGQTTAIAHWSDGLVTVYSPIDVQGLSVTQQPDSVRVGRLWPRPLVVQVMDVSGRPAAVHGAAIAVTVANGLGTLKGTQLLETTAQGRAVFDRLVLPTAGTYTLIVGIRTTQGAKTAKSAPIVAH